jgi:hypothetical protein
VNNLRVGIEFNKGWIISIEIMIFKACEALGDLFFSAAESLNRVEARSLTELLGH